MPPGGHSQGITTELSIFSQAGMKENEKMALLEFIGITLPMDSVSKIIKKIETITFNCRFINILNITLSLNVFLSLLCTCTCILHVMPRAVHYLVTESVPVTNRKKVLVYLYMHALVHTVFGYSTYFMYSSPLCIYIVHVHTCTCTCTYICIYSSGRRT